MVDEKPNRLWDTKNISDCAMSVSVCVCVLELDEIGIVSLGSYIGIAYLFHLVPILGNMP